MIVHSIYKKKPTDKQTERYTFMRIEFSHNFHHVNSMIVSIII